jgi:D-alanine--poly(phosphoribitol) ligase subunit 2
MHADVHDELRDQVGVVMSDRAGIEVPDAEADLLDAGLIDSLALVTLIVAFEDTFGVQLPLDDFDIDRFRSVASIAAFLASLGAEPVTMPLRRGALGPER